MGRKDPPPGCRKARRPGIGLSIVMMTMDEIRDDADMAETWPGSGVLNWGEIGFDTLAAWVALHPQQDAAATETFDVESVKGMFEEWWRTANARPHAPERRDGSVQADVGGVS